MFVRPQPRVSKTATPAVLDLELYDRLLAPRAPRSMPEESHHA